MLGLFFLNSSLLAKDINVAIFDTGFCHSKTFDATNSVKMTCPEQKNRKKRSFRYHGQWVLEQLKKELDGKKINIYPVIVFDKNSKQDQSYWRNAFDYISEKKIDIILLASSLPHSKEKISLKLPKNILTFIASGQTGMAIKKDTKLWPQSSNSDNMLIIGSYLEDGSSLVDDPNLIYREKIDYFFSGEADKVLPLKGSSLAVTKALAWAIKKCKTDFKKCLRKKRKLIKLWPLKEKFYSY